MPFWQVDSTDHTFPESAMASSGGSARRILNSRLRDPKAEFKDIFMCLKQTPGLGRQDWGRKIASPLIVAVESLRQDLVVLMVRQFGVDVNSVDQVYSEDNVPRPRCAIHRAVDTNNSAMVLQLLRLGADAIRIEAWSNIPSLGLVFGSALNNAIFAGYSSVINSIQYFVNKDSTAAKSNAGLLLSVPVHAAGSYSKPPDAKINEQGLDLLNDAVFDFLELETEVKGVESRIVGEKRPKMDQIKTLQNYMNQQRIRTKTVDYMDLKILEQHLSDYVTLQIEDKKLPPSGHSEDDRCSRRLVDHVMEQLTALLQCAQCQTLARPDLVDLGTLHTNMYCCQLQNHLVCQTCTRNLKIGNSGLDFMSCPICLGQEGCGLRSSLLADKLIECLAKMRPL